MGPAHDRLVSILDDIGVAYGEEIEAAASLVGIGQSGETAGRFR